MTNVPGALAKISFFKGYRQVDLSDSSSKIPVSLQLLRSALIIGYTKMQGEAEKVKRYTIRYCDIESIIPISTGLLINTKVERVVTPLLV